MRNQFQILDDRGDGFHRVLFEADASGDIYVWLKKNSALDAPGYKVFDSLTLTSWEEGVFIREFEEQMAKADAMRGKHKCLSEERVRTIVREEMSKLIDEARAEAGVAPYYDTETMSKTLIAIIDHLSERKVSEGLNSHEDGFEHGHGRL